MGIRIKDLLKDKTVLYVVCFVAFVNLLGYVMLRNTDAVSLFLIVGLLTSFFSKNMIVICLSAMIFTNLIVSLRRHRYIREGLENSNKKPKQKPKQKRRKQKQRNQNDDSKKESLRMIDEPDQTEESIIKDRAQVKPSSEDVEDVLTGRATDIDEAATIEKAMDQLDRTLSPEEKDDFKQSARDSLKQQQQLMQTLKELQPMADQATKMLDALGGAKGLHSVMNGMGTMMNSLNGFTQNSQ